MHTETYLLTRIFYLLLFTGSLVGLVLLMRSLTAKPQLTLSKAWAQFNSLNAQFVAFPTKQEAGDDAPPTETFQFVSGHLTVGYIRIVGPGLSIEELVMKSDEMTGGIEILFQNGRLKGLAIVHLASEEPTPAKGDAKLAEQFLTAVRDATERQLRGSLSQDSA